AYAGDELKGYGNLVLIRHSNNWVSAYAHNDEILVKRGDQVRRGQVIAKAGRTGQVNQPQLHFELRKGSRPVDPTKYMTSSTANADYPRASRRRPSDPPDFECIERRRGRARAAGKRPGERLVGDRQAIMRGITPYHRS